MQRGRMTPASQGTTRIRLPCLLCFAKREELSMVEHLVRYHSVSRERATEAVKVWWKREASE